MSWQSLSLEKRFEKGLHNAIDNKGRDQSSKYFALACDFCYVEPFNKSIDLITRNHDYNQLNYIKHQFSCIFWNGKKKNEITNR